MQLAPEDKKKVIDLCVSAFTGTKQIDDEVIYLAVSYMCDIVVYIRNGRLEPYCRDRMDDLVIEALEKEGVEICF